LNSPVGIAVDAAGNLYIADAGNYRIRKVTNGTITTVAGNGTAGFSGDNGPATDAELYYPTGVAVDLAGSLYIADFATARIRQVRNEPFTTMGGKGPPGFIGYTAPATSAQLNDPYGVAVDVAGSLYIADAENHCIRKVTLGTITTVAGRG